MKLNSELQHITRLLTQAKEQARKHDYRTLSYFIDMALVQAQDDICKSSANENAGDKISTLNGN